MVWGSAAQYSGQVGVAWDEKGVDYRDLFPIQPSDDERWAHRRAAVTRILDAVVAMIMKRARGGTAR